MAKAGILNLAITQFCGVALLVLVGTACADHEAGRQERIRDLNLSEVSEDTFQIAALQMDPPGPAASSPEEAVAQFLAAEMSGNFAESFGLLSSEDRSQYQTIPLWVLSHIDAPKVEAFTTADVQDLPSQQDAFSVRGLAQLQPRLDEFVGFVPAEAEAHFIAVPEDRGWRVAYSRTEYLPSYPPESEVAGVVDQWIRSASTCGDSGKDLEWDGGWVGVTGYADQLCLSGQRPSIGPVRELSNHANPAPLVSAFGTDALELTRFVQVDGDVQFDLVLAPFDGRWVVVGSLLPTL